MADSVSFGPRTRRGLRFHDLTWHRISEVLLVSSPYDAFILQQDGQLTEQMFDEYSDLSLPAPPRFTRASTGVQAIRRLRERKFDLVLTMTSLADMDVNDFGRKVKKLRPGRPVVLLALDRRELHDLRGVIDREAIDAAFLWSGDPKILLAIIKYVEDRENLEHDVEHGDVNVILVVEDSPAYYSSFLGLLYHELTVQSLALYREGANAFQRQMYMNARPRIVHATSYEEGAELFKRYRQHMLAIICDVGIPRRGELDESAGFDFIQAARTYNSDLPVLLQSADPEHRETADKLHADFIDKNAHDLLESIRRFLREDLGFGDFVFRSPDGHELDRARNLRELEEKLENIDGESIRYHSSHNHFSMWLMARSKFELARQIRPGKVSDFPTIEGTRELLIERLRDARRQAHRGEVADFDRRHFDQDDFIRLGKGSLGGKARGIAFLNRTLADSSEEDELGGMRVKLPKTIVITTEHFDEFLDRNHLRQLPREVDDGEIRRRFLAAKMSDRLCEELEYVVGHLRSPLAVRSSSLLEDSLHQRLAGLYDTVMLTNDAADPKIRLRQLGDAVKLVYASTFTRDARSYSRSTGKLEEEEKMAVILQELVGRRYGDRFYPAFSGVAQSFNFYPVGPQRPEDGVVHVALGFGRTVVEGGLALRFDPEHPDVLPQLAGVKTFLDRSQRSFFGLEMGSHKRPRGIELLSSLHCFDLAAAEQDGTLKAVGSVYSVEDRVIRDDLTISGPRLVTFNNILKHRAIPLPAVMRKVLALGKHGLGRQVEIEFAGELGPGGKPTLYLLQIRPFAARGPAVLRKRQRYRRRDRLCSSTAGLGNGIEEIHDCVYVRYDRWQAADNPKIAEEIGRLNQSLNETLEDEKRGYLLIGPGRWGTADPNLGIPVRWSQISRAKVIVEASPEGYDVEPSQGTHFFQNMTSLELGYLTLPPGALSSSKSGPDIDDREDFLDLAWLDAQGSFRETRHLRWLRFEEPLTVMLDGRRGRAVIAKPGTDPD